MQSTIKRENETKELYKLLLILAIPIIIQNTIINSVTMVDTVMIARLNTESVVATSIAGRLQFICTLIVYGFYSGSAVFISQYNGAEEYQKIKKTMMWTILLGLIIGGIFTAISLFTPRLYMSFFTKDETIIKLGISYLRVFAIGFLPFCISFSFIIALRSIKDSKIPMISSIISMMINIILNYCLIFGKFGFPKLDILGAGIATSVSRLVEMIIILYYVYFGKREKLQVSFKSIKEIDLEFIKKYFKLSYPIIISEGLYGFGVMAYFYVYSKLGTEMFAATQMAQTVNDITLPASFGLASATGTILGNKLGEGKVKEAIQNSRQIMKLTIFVGLGIGFMLMALIPVFPYIFKTSDKILHYMTIILFIRAIMNMFMPFNWSNVMGILRSGGDTLYAMFIDLSPMYLFSIPICMYLVTNWKTKGILIEEKHLITILIVLVLEEIIKLSLGLPRVLKNKWAKSLTKEIEE